MLAAEGLALVTLACLAMTVAGQELDCEYRYTEQPLEDPACSPYGDVMRINCTVEVPPDASDISIGWFLDCMELSNDSRVTIRSQDQYTDTVRRIRSQLVITDMNDDYAGDYTCNILGDEEFIPSKLFRLPDSIGLEVYLSLGLCQINVVFSIEEVKCAEITENRTIPMSLSCADPVAATSHAGTTITSTLVIQSTPISSLPSSLPSLTPSLPLTVPLHTNPSTPQPAPTTSAPAATDPSSTTAPVASPSIWLYIVVAVAAVLFMTMIVLLILCAGVCWNQSQRKQQALNCDALALRRRQKAEPNLYNL